MGLRETLLSWLAKGPEPESDPAEPVELVRVPTHRGPMIVAELASHGIVAHHHEASDPVTRSLTESRIIVARADLDQARILLDDIALS